MRGSTSVVLFRFPLFDHNLEILTVLLDLSESSRRLELLLGECELELETGGLVRNLQLEDLVGLPCNLNLGAGLHGCV